MILANRTWQRGIAVSHVTILRKTSSEHTAARRSPVTMEKPMWLSVASSWQPAKAWPGEPAVTRKGALLNPDELPVSPS